MLKHSKKLTKALKVKKSTLGSISRYIYLYIY